MIPTIHSQCFRMRFPPEVPFVSGSRPGSFAPASVGTLLGDPVRDVANISVLFKTFPFAIRSRTPHLPPCFWNVTGKRFKPLPGNFCDVQNVRTRQNRTACPENTPELLRQNSRRFPVRFGNQPRKKNRRLPRRHRTRFADLAIHP